MPEFKNHLSEASVEDFIAAVETIANGTGGSIRITERDRNMMRLCLTSQRVDGKGILVCIAPRRVDIESRRFHTSWSRR